MSATDLDCTLVRLAGYSGAGVFLATTRGGDRFVRKQAGSVDQGERLRMQMRMQQAFSRFADRPFLVPAILGHGDRGGVAYVDMEYVDGISAPAFLATQPLSAVRDFRHRVVEAIDYLGSRPPVFTPSDSPFVGLSRRVLRVAEQHREFSERHAMRILLALERWRGAGAPPPTLCHGDFSLENMLVTKDDHRLVLLDFLDGPWSHYWQDVSKLHVDLDAHWYARRFRPISEWTLRYIQEGIGSLLSRRDDGYRDSHALLLAINLARILPYATAEVDRALLLGQIERQLGLAEHIA